MVAERGGLRYPIEVVDRFTDNLLKFRDDVKAARAEFALFRRSVRGLGADAAGIKSVASSVQTLGRATRERTAAAAAGAAASEKSARAASKQQKAEASLLRDLQAVDKAQKDIAKVRNREAQLQRATDAEARRTQALRIRGIQEELKQQRATEKLRKNAFTTRRNLARQEARELIQQFRLRKQEQASQARSALAAEKAAKRQAVAQKNLTGALFGTDNAASRMAFTFRRLFGVLAAFTIVRKLTQAFTGLLRGGIEFAASIESAQIGIAGLFTAVGRVRNAQGEIVQGQEAFSIALAHSVEQTKALRQESLKTTATFQELLTTFQTAIAPGLTAGLNIDEIRQLTVRISQAATAISLPQNQLAEEIRSLLSGTIQARTTRIATALGISNADIKQAKELGQLFTFLEGKFNSFATSSAIAAKTLTGTFARFRGVGLEAIASGTGKLIDSLKAGMEGLINVLTTLDEKGNLRIDPGVTRVFETVFDAISRIVDRASNFFQSLNIESDVLPAVQSGISAIEHFIDGAIELGRALSMALLQILPLIRAIGALVSAFAPLLGILLQVQILFGTFRFLVTRVSAVTGILLATWRLLRGQVAAVAVETKAAKVSIGALAAGLSLAYISSKPLLEALLGVNLTLEQSTRLVALSLVDAIDAATTSVVKLGSKLQEALGIGTGGRSAIESAAVGFSRFGAALLAGIADATGADELADKIRKVLEQQITLDRKRDAEREGRAEDIDAKQLTRDEARQKRRLKFEQELADVLAEGTTGEGFDASLRRRLAAAEKAAAQAAGTIKAPATPVTKEEEDAIRLSEKKLALKSEELVLNERIAKAERLSSDKNLAAIEIAKARAFEARARGEVNLQFLDEEIKKQREISDEVFKREGSGARAGFEDKKLRDLEEERRNLERDITLEVEAQVDAQRRAEIEFKKSEARRKEELLVLTGSAGEGLTRGINNFVDQFVSAFQAGVTIMTGILTQFATFISDTIVDAFDPTKDTSLKERFARFLQDIAKLIIQTFVQLAIARLFLGLGFGGADTKSAFGTVPSFGGFAEGGPIPQRASRRASLHHRKAAGYASGGGVRPRGLDARDTVPIWAQPGEFMMTLNAVRKYGLQTMAQINAGMIDPSSLKALASSTTPVRVRAPRAGGLALGGAVPAQSAAPSTTVVQPTLVADESTLERLLAGGSPAMRRYMRKNSNEVRRSR